MFLVVQNCQTNQLESSSIPTMYHRFNNMPEIVAGLYHAGNIAWWTHLVLKLLLCVSAEY